MKAAVVPAVSSSWQIKDVPRPEPGTGQVLVKMRASGICFTDVHQTLGHLPDSFLVSSATSRSAKSSPWLLM
jgi:alcohol dehydrogenase